MPYTVTAAKNKKSHYQTATRLASQMSLYFLENETSNELSLNEDSYVYDIRHKPTEIRYNWPSMIVSSVKSAISYDEYQQIARYLFSSRSPSQITNCPSATTIIVGPTSAFAMGHAWTTLSNNDEDINDFDFAIRPKYTHRWKIKASHIKVKQKLPKIFFD